jgi:hypothetical protein
MLNGHSPEQARSYSMHHLELMHIVSLAEREP